VATELAEQGTQHVSLTTMPGRLSRLASPALRSLFLGALLLPSVAASAAEPIVTVPSDRPTQVVWRNADRQGEQPNSKAEPKPKKSFWCRVFFACGGQKEKPAPKAEPSRRRPINFQSPAGVARVEPNRKLRIAILDFDDAAVATSAAKAFSSKAGVGQQISDLLGVYLARDTRLSIVKRSDLDVILKEQSLSSSALTDVATVVKIGRALGVDAVLVGSVKRLDSDPEPHERAKVGAVGLALKRRPVDVYLTASLVDVSTGEIIGHTEGRGSSKEPRAGMLGGLSKKLSPSWNPVEGAVHDAVQTMSAAVSTDSARALAAGPVAGQVAGLDGTRVVISVGSEGGLKVGDELAVERVGREIRDPVTAHVLLAPKTPVGIVRVVSVSESAAVAEVVYGSDLRVNDVVRHVKR